MALGEELDAISAEPRRRPADLMREEVVPLAAEFGITRRHHSREPVEDELDALRRWVAGVNGDGRTSAVFMDTTTLFTVSAMLGLAVEAARPHLNPDIAEPSFYVTANTLLDLDTFIRCAVLYDRIVCLPNQSVDIVSINRAIGAEVVSLLPLPIEPGYATPGVVGGLTDLFESVSSDLNWLANARSGTAEGDDLEALKLAWERVLGRELSRQELFWPDRRADWASMGSQIVETLLASPVDASGQQSEVGLILWPRFIDECNLRSLFNQRLAGMLALPYAPNNARLPYRVHLLKNAAVAHDRFLDVAEIQRALRDQTMAYMRPYTLELPVFLTTVLARATSLRDVLAEVGRLRAMGEAYRAHRRELLDAVWRGDTRTMDSLRAAVQADTRAWRGALKASSALAVIGVLAATGYGLAALILTSLKLVKASEELEPAARAGLFRRVLRPEEWFLTQVGTSSRELVNTLPKLEQLWTLPTRQIEICRNRLLCLAELDGAWPAAGVSSARA
jgi:hypothetical protein